MEGEVCAVCRWTSPPAGWAAQLFTCCCTKELDSGIDSVFFQPVQRQKEDMIHLPHNSSVLFTMTSWLDHFFHTLSSICYTALPQHWGETRPRPPPPTCKHWYWLKNTPHICCHTLVLWTTIQAFSYLESSQATGGQMKKKPAGIWSQIGAVQRAEASLSLLSLLRRFHPHTFLYLINQRLNRIRVIFVSHPSSRSISPPAGKHSAFYSEYVQRERGATRINADWLITAADVRGVAAVATFVTERHPGKFPVHYGFFVQSWGEKSCQCHVNIHTVSVKHPIPMSLYSSYRQLFWYSDKDISIFQCKWQNVCSLNLTCDKVNARKRIVSLHSVIHGSEM